MSAAPRRCALFAFFRFLASRGYTVYSLYLYFIHIPMYVYHCILYNEGLMHFVRNKCKIKYLALSSLFIVVVACERIWYFCCWAQTRLLYFFSGSIYLWLRLFLYLYTYERDFISQKRHFK